MHQKIVLGGHCNLSAQGTRNGERLLQLCADNRLFLSLVFATVRVVQGTWPPNSTSMIQIDHTAVSYVETVLLKTIGRAYNRTMHKFLWGR